MSVQTNLQLCIFSVRNILPIGMYSDFTGALLNNARRCYTHNMRGLSVCFSLLVLSCLIASTGLLAAREKTASLEPALLHEFEAKYRHATRLQCNFLQRYSENGRLARTEAGRAYFLHPGKMRWDYEIPEKNTFLVDGKFVWFYSPVDHTATRTSTKNSEDWRTPLAFLTSDMSLSRICSKIESAADPLPFTPGDFLFRCQLRSNEGKDSAAVRTVLFEITPVGDLARIVVPQEGGIQHEFIFKDWQWDAPVPKDWFVFDPPRGVVIVDGLLPTAPGVRQ